MSLPYGVWEEMLLYIKSIFPLIAVFLYPQPNFIKLDKIIARKRYKMFSQDTFKVTGETVHSQVTIFRNREPIGGVGRRQEG